MKDGEILVDQYKTYYAVINDDGINRCAWCRKPMDEITNFEEHAEKHELEEK